MLVRNISCCYQALVLLGKDSFCWLWEAGSSLLFWRREVTGEGSCQTETKVLYVNSDPLRLAVWLQGWENWATCWLGLGTQGI